MLITCRHLPKCWILPKQIFNHFKGIYPAKIEAYLYNINDLNTEIKVIRNIIQTSKAELASQVAASLMLVHMIEMVPKQKNENKGTQ